MPKPKRTAHRAAILVGGPEDGCVELVPADLDEIIVTTHSDGRALNRYYYDRTNRFVRRKRVYDLVAVFAVSERDQRRQRRS